jgi:hypothetical protein
MYLKRILLAYSPTRPRCPYTVKHSFEVAGNISICLCSLTFVPQHKLMPAVGGIGGKSLKAFWESVYQVDFFLRRIHNFCILIEEEKKYDYVYPMYPGLEERNYLEINRSFPQGSQTSS